MPDIYDPTTQYVKWYNREVQQFFDGSVCDGLHSSYVHAGSVYSAEQEEEEDDEESVEIGTLWSGKEKGKFFTLLSRYSIHRLDEWVPHFQGSKSREEILLYYRVLHAALERMKETSPHKLLKYDDYPIAYEVDDTFIEFEEHMSVRLGELPGEGETPTTLPGREGQSDIINMARWNSRWRNVYGKSKVVGTVDTSHPENINNEDDYRDKYGLYQEEGELKGRRYVVSQYDRLPDTSMHHNIERSLTCMPKCALPLSDAAAMYVDSLIREHTRTLIYKCVLPNINERSVACNELYKVGKIGKKKKNKKKDRLASRHIVSGEDVHNGLMLMRREGELVKNSSVGVVETLNKFELAEMCADNNTMFAERVFLQSLLPAIVYDKLNHPIPVVNHSRSHDTVDKLDRLLARPVDRELQLICDLLKDSVPHDNTRFQIVNDNTKWHGHRHINAVLNRRLDSPAELAVLARETQRLERGDLLQSRRYMDTVYHYMGTLANLRLPGGKLSKKRVLDVLNRHVIVTDTDINTENTVGNGGEIEDNSQHNEVFDRVNW